MKCFLLTHLTFIRGLLSVCVLSSYGVFMRCLGSFFFRGLLTLYIFFSHSFPLFFSSLFLTPVFLISFSFLFVWFKLPDHHGKTSETVLKSSWSRRQELMQRDGVDWLVPYCLLCRFSYITQNNHRWGVTNHNGLDPSP